MFGRDKVVHMHQIEGFDDITVLPAVRYLERSLLLGDIVCVTNETDQTIVPWLNEVELGPERIIEVPDKCMFTGIRKDPALFKELRDQFAKGARPMFFHPTKKEVGFVEAAGLTWEQTASCDPDVADFMGKKDYLRQVAQKINAANNEFQLAWVGTAASYQLVIGSTPGSSNILPPTVVPGTTYTWISPRTGGTYYARVAAKSGDSLSGYSDELSLFVLDIRNVIDAMYFHAGPMADSPANANSNPVTAVWADGTRLSVLVSNEAGSTALANAQTFTGQYADLIGGAVTAAFSMTSDAMHAKDSRTFPDFTIGVRVQQ